MKKQTYLGCAHLQRKADVLREAARDALLLRLHRVPLPRLQEPLRLLP